MDQTVQQHIVWPNTGCDYYDGSLSPVVVVVVVEPGQMFVKEVVHIQWSQLFKVLEFSVYEIVHYKEPVKPFNKSRASFCRDIAMNLKKATSSNIPSLTHFYDHNVSFVDIHHIYK